jgi:hypothetical protein
MKRPPKTVDTMSGPGPEYCGDCWGRLPRAPAPKGLHQFQQDGDNAWCRCGESRCDPCHWEAPAPSDAPPLWTTCDEDGIPVYLVKKPVYDALAARVAALEAERDALKAEVVRLKEVHAKHCDAVFCEDAGRPWKAEY